METSPELLRAESIYLATHFYGVPDDKAISQEQAVAIGLQTVAQQDIQKEVIPWYQLRVRYYDVTDPDRPMWKLTFCTFDHVEEIIANNYDDPNVLVCIDPYTGEVVRTQVYHRRDITEEAWAELIN